MYLGDGLDMTGSLVVILGKRLYMISVQVFRDIKLFWLTELYLGDDLEMADHSVVTLGERHSMVTVEVFQYRSLGVCRVILGRWP